MASKLTCYFKSAFLAGIIILLSVSFITVLRPGFFPSVYYFDIFLVIYITSSFFLNPRIKISKASFNILKLSSIILFPSFFLIIFSVNVQDSLQFFIQYIFSIVGIVLFLDAVKYNNQLKFLFWALLTCIVLNSILFIVGKTLLGLELYFPDKWNGRFALGDLTPNDVGHFLVLGLFFVDVLLIGKKRFLFYALLFPAYVMTLSKTVWIQICGYFYFHFKKYILLLILLVVIVIVLSNDAVYQTVLSLLGGFSTINESNNIRVEMFYQSVLNLVDTIFWPAYHSVDNISEDYQGAVSAHNGVSSYVTNFGLVSFVLLYLVVIFKSFKNYRSRVFRILLPFIILDLITIIFNPLMNLRILWFPIILYIFLVSHFNKVCEGENCIFDKLSR